MKHLLLTTVSILAIGLSAQAHTTKAIKKASNTKVEAARKAGDALVKVANGPDDDYRGFVSATYKVTKFSPVQKADESRSKFMIRVLKNLLHRDYPITGDDGGYSFMILNGKPAENIKDYLPEDWSDRGDDQMNEAVAELAVRLADASTDKDVLVVVGDGSGNNTFAEIVSVIDLKKQEVYYLMNSNFGSDN